MGTDPLTHDKAVVEPRAPDCMVAHVLLRSAEQDVGCVVLKEAVATRANQAVAGLLPQFPWRAVRQAVGRSLRLVSPSGGGSDVGRLA